MMQHKGYIGVARVDDEAGLIRGRVVNIRDLITFHGRTVEEARQAFQESVDDYLEFCAARGEEPDKPFSGRFVIRMKPEVHRALAIEAQRRGTSINTLVNRTLARVARVSPGTSTPDPAKPAEAQAVGKAKAPRARKVTRKGTKAPAGV
jgi:predicted HicB family RNase H-like nuclease